MDVRLFGWREGIQSYNNERIFTQAYSRTSYPQKIDKNKPTIVVSTQLFCNDRSYDIFRYGNYRIHMGQALEK